MPDKKTHSGSHIGLTDGLAAHATGIDPTVLQAGYALLEEEKGMGLRQCLSTHWRAALWSAFLSTALWMEGFDTSIVNSFFGQAQFLSRFGIKVGTKLTIPANWQSGLTNAVTVGEIVGLVVTGIMQERLGSKVIFVAGMIAMIGAIFIAVFAQSLPMLIAAELVMGIPWGMFQTMTTAYAAEICPIGLRGYLTSYVAMGWGGGGPWWLARHGRYEDAKVVLRRITSPHYWDTRDLDAYVAIMKHTDDMEKAESSQGSWLELFKGTNLRRTEITVGTWIIQVWNGNLITTLTVELLESAGMSATGAFNLNLIQNAMSVIGICVSWILLPRVGRRWLYIDGLISEAVCLLPIGILGCIDTGAAGARAIGALTVMINLLEHFAIGPVFPSARLRARTIVFGRAMFCINSIIGNQLNPRFVAADGWNWGAKSAFFHLGTNLLCTTWSYFRLPETGGLSFADLDILFANKVNARKFKDVVIHDESAGNAKMADDEEAVGIEKEATDHAENAPSAHLEA
ncbi:hypothetical protein EHS25_007415 [Saitozyma podzolica]|uniref:Major facilitator superfamily (MFS) profile domain-containing protein n=1 Tax=Saitozyma podzolica TaxID=1890683 RepID=A0A427YPN1_9TREE|nr:hypothetical protein EHS25_007415 [Saitozyma podzolica]